VETAKVGLAPWLEEFYVCASQGRRWKPQWKSSGRVKVSFEQLKLWYQTLDDRLAQKARLEKEIYVQVRNLFSLQPDLVFYDLTSTDFEGAGPASLARFGYRRDERPRNRQILAKSSTSNRRALTRQVRGGVKV